MLSGTCCRCLPQYRVNAWAFDIEQQNAAQYTPKRALQLPPGSIPNGAGMHPINGMHGNPAHVPSKGVASQSQLGRTVALTTRHAAGHTLQHVLPAKGFASVSPANKNSTPGATPKPKRRIISPKPKRRIITVINEESEEAKLKALKNLNPGGTSGALARKGIA